MYPCYVIKPILLNAPSQTAKVIVCSITIDVIYLDKECGSKMPLQLIDATKDF